MSFSNDVLDINTTQQDALLASLPMQALSPKYRVLNLLTTTCFYSFIILIIAVLYYQRFVAMPQWFTNYAVLIACAIATVMLLSLLYHFFADPLKQYALREQDLNFQSGLFFRRIVSQPILRIQHIEIKRGPLERWANLATLQVFSAGGTMHTFEIPGLEHELAIELRQFILDHTDLQAAG